MAGWALVSPLVPSSKRATGHDEVEPELLASASRADSGSAWLKANVYLTRPDQLYAQQQSRRFWFGSLIITCAAAALVGLLASWRAFQRQQRLSELKSDIVSSVSHELRTPMAAVQL